MIDEKNLFSHNHIINNILSLDKLFIVSRFEKSLIMTWQCVEIKV